MDHIDHHRLRRAALTVQSVPADGDEARACLLAYAAELADRFPEGYDAAALSPPDQLAAVLLARENDRPVGCGAWHRLAPGVAEVRHLWVHPDARGLGLGRRLLHAIETDAAAQGATLARLGTHRALTEAAALYQAAGYHPIANYSDSPYNHLAFEKALTPTP